ncbi:hypothetical protein D3C75_1351020 [compost metagenome]
MDNHAFGADAVEHLSGDVDLDAFIKKHTLPCPVFGHISDSRVIGVIDAAKVQV